MKETKQAKLNHVRSVNFTQSESKRPRDYTCPAGCIERFQKQRLQNFFDHVYFYVDTDEKETLLAL